MSRNSPNYPGTPRVIDRHTNAKNDMQVSYRSYKSEQPIQYKQLYQRPRDISHQKQKLLQYILWEMMNITIQSCAWYAVH